jgi:sterol desaturase/sphingolipid hydroxylase (fatty acid hydroxylase superfamily)
MPKVTDELDDVGVSAGSSREEIQRKLEDYIQSNLRAAEWKEVGPDMFFVGVNAVVAAFSALLYGLGAFPSLDRTKVLSWDWVAQVFLVNWVVMYLGYEGYHYIFHNGGYKLLYGVKPTKFNPASYEPGQLERERLYTTLSMGIASLYQCFALHGWAKGWFSLAYLDYRAVPLWQFGLTFLLLGLWSDFHFYWCHRALHTDLLYGAFHKLHHKSKNPGPWSGMSMHPVESILYLSKILGALLIPSHPLHFFFIVYNSTLMPIPGHSGHEELLGNEYHWIHVRVSVFWWVCCVFPLRALSPHLLFKTHRASSTTCSQITMEALRSPLTSFSALTISSNKRAIRQRA